MHVFSLEIPLGIIDYRSRNPVFSRNLPFGKTKLVFPFTFQPNFQCFCDAASSFAGGQLTHAREMIPISVFEVEAYGIGSLGRMGGGGHSTNFYMGMLPFKISLSLLLQDAGRGESLRTRLSLSYLYRATFTKLFT